MKAIVDTKALKAASALAAAAVKDRSPVPTMLCTLLVAEKVGLQPSLLLTGTDGEARVTARVEAVDVQDPGTAAVPTQRIEAILGEATGATVTLETEDQDKLRIAEDHGKFTLWGYPPKDFPAPPPPPDAGWVTLAANDARRIIAAGSIAWGKDTNAYCLKGAKISVSGAGAEVVSTDGKSLARATVDINLGAKWDAVVPHRSVQVFRTVLDAAGEEPVHLAATATHIFILVGDRARPLLAASSVLLEGTFPPYADVIPSRAEREVHGLWARIEAPRLASAARRATMFRWGQNGAIVLTFSATELLVEGANEEGYAGVVLRPALGPGFKEPMVVALHYSYLLEACTAADGGEIAIWLEAPNKAVLVTAPGLEYVMMPMAPSAVPPVAERCKPDTAGRATKPEADAGE